jgi:hypothetical protein
MLKIEFFYKAMGAKVLKKSSNLFEKNFKKYRLFNYLYNALSPINSLNGSKLQQRKSIHPKSTNFGIFLARI